MLPQVNIKIPYKHQKCPILSKGFFFLSKEEDCKYLYLIFFPLQSETNWWLCLLHLYPSYRISLKTELRPPRKPSPMLSWCTEDDLWGFTTQLSHPAHITLCSRKILLKNPWSIQIVSPTFFDVKASPHCWIREQNQPGRVCSWQSQAHS